MVKDHSDSKRGNLHSNMGYSFRLAARVLLYMHHPTDRITHTTAFDTPVVEHWMKGEIANEGSIRLHTHYGQMLYHGTKTVLEVELLPVSCQSRH